MRTLKFEGESKEYFNIIYEGLIATQTKGQDTRILSKIFIKMEDEGEIKPNTPFYVLGKDSAIIRLEDAEFDLMKRLLDTVEWNGFGAKKAGKVMLWLLTIPEETLKIEK